MRTQFPKVWRHAAFAVVAMLCVGAAFAQAYPAKPIRVIIPWPAGGAVESLTRVIGAKMSDVLGQPLVLESRPGANGTIGVTAAAKSAPDGYTLLVGHVGPLAISPALQSNLQFDTVKDFEPIGQLVSGPTLLVVRPDLPIRSVKELIDYARANPGKLNYGSVGMGSTTHLAGEMLRTMTGIDILHVPYKGAPPIVTDLLGGRIGMSFVTVTSVLPHVRSGAMRAIAISSLARSPLLPDLPTVSETLPGFELSSWHGLLAPAGTPKAVVSRVYESVAVALKAPDVVQWLRENGMEPGSSGPEAFGSYIRSETGKWARLVKEAKVVID